MSGEMEFVQGKIPEEKVLGGGAVFPITLNPPSSGGGGMCGTSQLVEMIKENRGRLVDLLRRHSAVLFRGFGVSSPEEFGRVVEAFGWKEMPYLGFIDRKKVVDGVYTANEAPIDQPIGFHHEMSTIKEFPSKIFFFCEQPSPQGGETSILPSYTILEKMEDHDHHFVSKLVKNGFMFKSKTAKPTETKEVVAKTWQSFLGTEDKIEAQRRAIEKLGCNSIEFKEDGSAEIIYGPLNPIKEFGGKKVWFHHLVGRSAGDADVYFGDGTPLPRTSLDDYTKVTNENCVDIKWQKGDVLLVDNLCVQHARRAGEAPRRILVSICR